MKIRVKAAVVDTRQLTLYHEDGQTTQIPQGDDRLKKITDMITPIISAGGIAEVELDNINVFSDFEEKSSGLVRFFRVAKNKLTGLFRSENAEPAEPVEPMNIEPPAPFYVDAKSFEIVDPNVDRPVTETDVTAQVATLNNAIDNIIANAVPVKSAEYSQRKTAADETIVAVVEREGTKTMVPGVEKLQGQLRHANAALGSPAAVAKFLERVGAVAYKRNHTAQELMNFMEKGDLPIAEDGSIIAYKVLKTKAAAQTKGVSGIFVDCHSGGVTQRVGSFVSMDEKLVDPSRRQECSTGLHVARRSYLGGFSGDVITLIKIAPEDVIAVPEYESSKMRVRGYHIISEIPKEQHGALRSNKSMTDSENMAARLLGMAIRGEHSTPIEDVVIGGARGTNVTITPRTGHKQLEKPVVTEATPAAKAIDLDGKRNSAPAVDPKAVARTVAESRQAPAQATPAPKAQTAPENRQQKAQRLYAKATAVNNPLTLRQAAAQDLLEHKKASKIGWTKLGFDQTAVEQDLKVILDMKPEVVPPKQAPVPNTPPALNQKDQALAYWKGMRMVGTTNADKHGYAVQLRALKKTAKRSWEKLGLDTATVEAALAKLLS